MQGSNLGICPHHYALSHLCFCLGTGCWCAWPSEVPASTVSPSPVVKMTVKVIHMFMVCVAGKPKIRFCGMFSTWGSTRNPIKIAVLNWCFPVLFCFYLFCIDPDEFERIYEPLDVKSKKIHIVDSGLTFNLPYPLILRPQRGVDLIISFDFSARPSDSSPPFKVSKTGHSFPCVNKFMLTLSSSFFLSVGLAAHFMVPKGHCAHLQHWSNLFPHQGRIFRSVLVSICVTHMMQPTQSRQIQFWSL